jgi:hypothetical protein
MVCRNWLCAVWQAPKDRIEIGEHLTECRIEPVQFASGMGIDYKCADGRCLMSPHGMAVSYHKYLPSSETRINAGIRGWKRYLSEWTCCQESAGGICFTNKWGAASLQPSTFSNHCSNSAYSNASPDLTVRFFFVGEHRDFLKEGVKTYRMAPMSPLDSPTFFCLHIYSLYGGGRRGSG